MARAEILGSTTDEAGDGSEHLSFDAVKTNDVAGLSDFIPLPCALLEDIEDTLAKRTAGAPLINKD